MISSVICKRMPERTCCPSTISSILRPEKVEISE